jgi:DNA-binding MarR family transcriptional regulator
MSDFPPPLDHVGWDLARAGRAWKAAFVRAMAARGHTWIAEGRGSLVEHIGRSGAAQNDIVRASGISKQAVQQGLDALAADGVIERVPDPEDARRNVVRFTKAGLRALRDADSVKLEIERRLVRRLGEPGLTRLKAALKDVAGELE